MKTYKIFPGLLALILLTCLSGVQGQYSMPTGGYPTGMETVGAATMGSPNSQYYQMLNGPIPSTHISAPEQFDITGNAPSSVLFSNQGQPVNYAQYATSPSYMGSSSLWVQGLTSWAQSTVVPQGATVNLLAITPSGGSGYLYFQDSDGQMYTYNYYFYPYSRMTFYADKPGRHVFYFVVNGMVSNQVIIDVTGTYAPPSNYLPPAYYPYYNGFFPGFPGFDNFGERRGTEHEASTETTGTHITGAETGEHVTSEVTTPHITGGETGDHVTSEVIAPHITGDETGDHVSIEPTGTHVTGETIGTHITGTENRENRDK